MLIECFAGSVNCVVSCNVTFLDNPEDLMHIFLRKRTTEEIRNHFAVNISSMEEV